MTASCDLIQLCIVLYFVHVGTSGWQISFDKSPETNTFLIWPLPRHTSALTSEEVSMYIGSNVKFKVNITSKVLQTAVEKYKLLLSIGDHSQCTHKAVELNTINVLVSDDSEDLNSDRKYEVIVSSEIKEVTIIANSPFGAM